MKNNEIVSILHAGGKVSLWVPSLWVDVTVMDWPGRLNRYRVWQGICEQQATAGPFDFEHAFDASSHKTWASVLRLKQDKWAVIPAPIDKIRLLTAPKAVAQAFLPRRNAPFSLMAYRWQGEIELCAYRLGLLQHAERGRDVSAIWSKVIQMMPVLAAAPLYSMEEGLTRLFQAHHSVCHTVPVTRSRLAQLFESMREKGVV